MKLVTLLLGLFVVLIAQNASSQENKQKSSRLSVGGYGEVVYQHFDYSADFNRFTYPENFSDKVSRGQTDIPHLVFFLSYDFGNGWKISSEIEIEHAGVGAEMEIEAEEFGEYETEVEKGGEVVIEQFWIEKSISSQFNIRAGHLIVPVGLTNLKHLPVEYFTVLRPEGEHTILPQTWHENGISVHGRLRNWQYEVQLVNALDVDAFGSANWVNGGSVSPYEYKLATNMAGVVRIDNYSVKGLRLGVSTYVGNSTGNSLKEDRYEGLNGRVWVEAVDGEYISSNFIGRGSLVYGNLSESAEISRINKNLPSAAPSPHTDVAKNAMSVFLEAGYNIFSFFPQQEDKLYLFAHYNHYNSMHKTVSGMLADARYKRSVYTAGVNYYPIPQVAVKAEYGMRKFDKPYNQENTISLGIVFSGIFN